MSVKSRNRNNNTKQVVILGAGFGGIRSALDLAKRNKTWDIVLVSNKSYQDYHAALYEVATLPRLDGPAIKLKSTVALPLSEIISKRKNIVFKQAWVNGIDLDKKIVRTDDGDLHYDGLVIALGSQTDFFNIPGLKENSLTLKCFEDAINIRNKMAAAINLYLETQDKTYLNFVIGGGGFTGVELAGELVNYLKHLIQDKNIPKPQIWLVEGTNQLLPGLLPKVAEIVYKRLESLGVKIKLNSIVVSADSTGIVLENGEKIKARTIIWTGGVRSITIPFSKKVACDKKDRVIISRYLNLEVHPEVFVIGDCALYIDPHKDLPLPPTAQVAIKQAKYVAKIMPHALSNSGPIPPFKLAKSLPFLIPLSGKYALFVDGDKFREGFIIYLWRRLADLRYFLSVLPWYRALAYWFKGSLVYLKND